MSLGYAFRITASSIAPPPLHTRDTCLPCAVITVVSPQRIVVCVQRKQRSRSDVRVDLLRHWYGASASHTRTLHPQGTPRTCPARSQHRHALTLALCAQMPCLQLSWEWLRAPDSFLVYILECCSKCLCPRCLCFVCSCEHLVRSICFRLMCSLRVLFWSGMSIVL